ncbi:hypothetical protein N9B13_02485 [Akkermansiaceae bacterium]|nr:hypothetical protein [Akkermansiaceae bacterium]
MLSHSGEDASRIIFSSSSVNTLRSFDVPGAPALLLLTVARTLYHFSPSHPADLWFWRFQRK